jgi:hypothetical protein
MHRVTAQAPSASLSAMADGAPVHVSGRQSRPKITPVVDPDGDSEWVSWAEAAHLLGLPVHRWSGGSDRDASSIAPRTRSAPHCDAPPSRSLDAGTTPVTTTGGRDAKRNFPPREPREGHHSRSAT